MVKKLWGKKRCAKNEFDDQGLVMTLNLKVFEVGLCMIIYLK